MKRFLILIILPVFVNGAQRVIVAEEFTATGCTYCPGAARGLDELYERVYDSLVVIAYHISDPFSIPEADARWTYYEVVGIPRTFFDGILSEIGGLHYGTTYPRYLHRFNQRKGIESLLEIDLNCSYESDSNTGVVTA